MTEVDIDATKMWRRRYVAVQGVLDDALGDDEGGEGIAQDVALLAAQRDTARRQAAGYAAELEEAVRERTTAEAKLARITTVCCQRLDAAIVQGPLSRLCQEIRAIISDEEMRVMGSGVERAVPGNSESEDCGCGDGPRGCCASWPGRPHDLAHCTASPGMRDAMADHDEMFHAGLECWPDFSRWTREERKRWFQGTGG